MIDGVISKNVGMDAINPQDIQDIQVLKDASATAIYGAMGGNGVILVTTKRGTKDRLTLNYGRRDAAPLFCHPPRIRRIYL